MYKNFVISNKNIQVEINNLGARVCALKVNGTDIALGFNSAEEYLKNGTYFGATIGRVANRIANGKFVLNGKEYLLTRNEGNNHHHGGFVGFDKKIFDCVDYTQNSVTLQCKSADGEEGYPGNFTLTVKYTAEDGGLLIEFAAASDKDTLWNPTHHTFFNLDGENGGDCKHNLLWINSDYYTPVDGGRVPTGEIAAVKNTPFDFNALKAIGADFGKEELSATNGYDHNYILKSGRAARAQSEKTGIKMDVYTDLPCMQFYSGGLIKPCKGKTREYNVWSGFCLEPQYCPNAINLQSFDKPILKKNETKTHFIKFLFS